MENNAEKICPTCQTANPVAANFCRHCRHEFSVASKEGTELSPIIKDFHIKETDYTIGSKIHLQWDVDNAIRILLNDKDVTNQSVQEVLVEKPLSLILSAENDYNVVSKRLNISPSPLPNIRQFNASATCILEEQEVRLEWKVENASKIELISQDSNSVVQNDDFILINPHKSDTYKLRCHAIADANIYVEQSISIQVVLPVAIDEFTTDNDILLESEKATLKWRVKNAKSIELLPLQSDVTQLKELQVSPTQSTEYRLIARNELSEAEASVTISVRNLPDVQTLGIGTLADIQLPSCQIVVPSYTIEQSPADVRLPKLNIKGKLKRCKINMGKIHLKGIPYPSIIKRMINKY